jgi:hypothetical protein
VRNHRGKILLFSLILLTIGMFQVSAQNGAAPSNLYVKTVLVSKVYSHNLGYRLLFLKSDLSIGEVFIPMAWFDQGSGKGELVLGIDRSYPYLSVFYVDGQFSHVRLYLYSDTRHPSYGFLSQPERFDGSFGIDTLDISF